jgi:hypothetical protein
MSQTKKPEISSGFRGNNLLLGRDDPVSSKKCRAALSENQTFFFLCRSARLRFFRLWVLIF